MSEVIRLHPEVHLILTPNGNCLIDCLNKSIVNFPIKLDKKWTENFIINKFLPLPKNEMRKIEKYRKIIEIITENDLGLLLDETINENITEIKLENKKNQVTIIEWRFNPFNIKTDFLNQINRLPNITLFVFINSEYFKYFTKFYMNLKIKYNVILINNEKNIIKQEEIQNLITVSNLGVIYTYYDDICYNNIKSNPIINLNTHQHFFMFSSSVYEQSFFANTYYYGRIYIDSNWKIFNDFNSTDELGIFDEHILLPTLDDKLLENSKWFLNRNNIADCKTCILKNFCIKKTKVLKVHDNPKEYRLLIKCKDKLTINDLE